MKFQPTKTGRAYYLYKSALNVNFLLQCKEYLLWTLKKKNEEACLLAIDEPWQQKDAPLQRFSPAAIQQTQKMIS